MPQSASGPRVRTEFPHRIREVDHVWIPLADGTRLSARLWLPVDAERHPVPAILEYLPYRKDDGTAPQDALRHPYFAGFGYAAVRVDMRGTGDSDGVLGGEYLPQEQDDALEVLAWLAEQQWCTGDVGMIGYSWGGFNGLQIAARRPPQLKAIISGYSTDDRYLDDCHYAGGCLLGSDMLKWASTMLAINALPPDPRIVGDSWRETWLERARVTPPFAEAWIKHQRRDDFWKQGSIAEDYSAITCAVMLVGGWADAYTNAVPRMLERLECPRRAIIGPWGHILPERGVPGPAIGFLQECVRWWDRWLKGIDTGVDDEPTLWAWMQEPAPPATYYPSRPGRWVAEPSWPPPGVRTREWALPGTEERSIVGVQSCGQTVGVWCANGLPAELADDQRIDDERSMCFDTEPLTGRLELLGYPEAFLDVSVDRSQALVAVRLGDVAPDGSSALLSWGQLNLTHREDHEALAAVEPGRRYSVSVRLNVVGQAVEVGHRLRLAVSPTYWPSAWPSPEPVTLTVHLGGASRLVLPVREPRPGDDEQPDFGEPEVATPLVFEAPPRGERTRTIERDAATGLVVMTDRELREVRLAGTGTRDTERNTDTWSIDDDDPLSARVRCTREFELDREGWRIRVVTASEMTADAAAFHVKNRLEAFEAGERVFDSAWERAIPRDGV